VQAGRPAVAAETGCTYAACVLARSYRRDSRTSACRRARQATLASMPFGSTTNRKVRLPVSEVKKRQEKMLSSTPSSLGYGNKEARCP
jgi:hypothetical protein